VRNGFLGPSGAHQQISQIVMSLNVIWKDAQSLFVLLNGFVELSCRVNANPGIMNILVSGFICNAPSNAWTASAGLPCATAHCPVHLRAEHLVVPGCVTSAVIAWGGMRRRELHGWCRWR